MQIVGGLGDPAVPGLATHLTGRLADLTGADPVFLPLPALVEQSAARRTLTKDPLVVEVDSLWQKLTWRWSGSAA